MKKRIPALLLAFVMALSLLPTAAFADSETTGTTVSATATLIDSIDLTDEETNKDKTLEKEGYTWDSTTNTLTLQNINVRESIKLPKASVIINIKGNCDAGTISREDSGANQATFVFGESGATLNANIEVAGNLNFLGVTMVGGSIDNGNVGAENVLTISNSNIALTKMSWMTNGGIALVNSNLNVVQPTGDAWGQFWAEFIEMDKNSSITSAFNIGNYGNRNLSDFGDVLNYVVSPVGGKFHQDNGEAGTQRPIYIVDANGEYASSFSLKGSATPAIGDLGSEDKDITIAVDGVTTSSDAVYGTTIAWETPTFTYEVAGGATTRWNPETHTYATTGGAINGSFDKSSFGVKVYNHSNADINVASYVGASAAATTTSYKVSGYDLSMKLSNPDGLKVTMPAAEPESALESVVTAFTLSISGADMDKFATDLIAGAANEAKLGTVVVVIGKNTGEEPAKPDAATLAPQWLWREGMTVAEVAAATSITFMDSYTPTGLEDKSWSADNLGNGSITGYLKGTDVIVAGNGNGRIIANADSTYMFADFSELQTIKGLELLDTTNVTRLSYTFSGCVKLESLDVSGWDTSKVTRMVQTFGYCEKLTGLDLSGWDTSSLTAMSNMFKGCSALKSISLSKDFKFVGTDGYLPTPSSSKIDGADGKWYAPDGTGYTPAEMNDVVRTETTTYVAVNPNA